MMCPGAPGGLSYMQHNAERTGQSPEVRFRLPSLLDLLNLDDSFLLSLNGKTDTVPGVEPIEQ
jgi:hypothetical protein